MATQIGIFEAKTKLSEIIRKVENGERFTITVRGKAVADMVPSQEDHGYAVTKLTAEQKEAAFERLRKPQITGLSHEEIRAAIEEGRA